MIKIYLIFLNLLIHPIMSSDLTTITCDEPKGTRLSYDQQSGLAKPIEDGFSKVRPSFIYHKNPQKITVLWGNTGLTGDTTPKGSEALVVFENKEQLVAVEAEQAHFWTHSIFPKSKIVFSTRQGISSNQPYSSTYFMKCVVK